MSADQVGGVSQEQCCFPSCELKMLRCSALCYHTSKSPYRDAIPAQRMEVRCPYCESWFEPTDKEPLDDSVRPQKVQTRDEMLRGLADFFEESVHLVWSNDEVSDCLRGMIDDDAASAARTRPDNNAHRDALQKIADSDQHPDTEDTAAELREIARNALEGRQ